MRPEEQASGEEQTQREKNLEEAKAAAEETAKEEAEHVPPPVDKPITARDDTPEQSLRELTKDSKVLANPASADATADPFANPKPEGYTVVAGVQVPLGPAFKAPEEQPPPPAEPAPAPKPAGYALPPLP